MEICLVEKAMVFGLYNPFIAWISATTARDRHKILFAVQGYFVSCVNPARGFEPLSDASFVYIASNSATSLLRKPLLPPTKRLSKNCAVMLQEVRSMDLII